MQEDDQTPARRERADRGGELGIALVAQVADLDDRVEVEVAGTPPRAERDPEGDPPDPRFERALAAVLAPLAEGPRERFLDDVPSRLEPDDRGEPALKGCVPAAVQIFESLRAVVHHHVRVERRANPLAGLVRRRGEPADVLVDDLALLEREIQPFAAAAATTGRSSRVSDTA